MNKDEGSSGFESANPEDHDSHAHFMCKGCETVFCTKHPDYANMKEGDACPQCHIAVVTELKLQRLPFDGMPPGLASVFGETMGMLDEQNHTSRVRGLLDAASRLYPYVTAVFPDPADAGVFKAGGEVTENDVARSLRCVEIVMGMEAAIEARIEKQEQQQQQEQGE